MKETPYQIISIHDGDPVNPDLVDEFQLGNLCTEKRYAFVGFINKKDKMLIACPKHFPYANEEDIGLIVRCIMKSAREKDKGSVEQIDCNIPFPAYVQVLDYYYKHGLFKHVTKRYRQGYSGNIDWNRTMRKSQKLVSNGNLLFLPFEVRDTSRQDTLIGECMQYVLNDGYERFGKYVGIGEKIDTQGYRTNFADTESVIRLLHGEEEKHFRDSEIQLIYALISYFSWEGSLSENSYFVTQSFELSWETMVQHYLNENYSAYDLDNQRMLFEKGCRKYCFRKQSDHIESRANHPKNHGFQVEYDHFLELRDEKKKIVFDSKYYVGITGVNYKQVAYHYFLMNNSEKEKLDAGNIINGLILPTEDAYHSRTHIDRRDIDGIYIQEHYFNVRDVMQNYV